MRRVASSRPCFVGVGHRPIRSCTHLPQKMNKKRRVGKVAKLQKDGDRCTHIRCGRSTPSRCTSARKGGGGEKRESRGSKPPSAARNTEKTPTFPPCLPPLCCAKVGVWSSRCGAAAGRPRQTIQQCAEGARDSHSTGQGKSRKGRAKTPVDLSPSWILHVELSPTWF